MNFSISSSDMPNQAVAAAKCSDARRFLGYALLSGLVGLAALWLITAKLRDGFLPLDYAAWQTKMEMVAKCGLPDTVVVGDSRAAAGFIPSSIPGIANLAMGLVTPIELYYQARNILNCPQVPKRVVLSISIPQLEQADQFWNRNVLFGLLTFDDLEDVRRQSRAINDKMLFSQPTIGDIDAILNNWMCTHQFPSFYFSSLINGGVIGRLSANHRLREKIAQSGGHLVYGTAPGSDGVSIDGAAKEFHAAPILDYYFRQTISLFSSKGIEVVFLSVPVNEATYQTITPSVERDFTDYITSLTRKNSNFRVIGDPLRHWDNKWFGDANHLNEAGAQLFSTQAAQLLVNKI